jgi:hypothetical protein
VPLNQLPSTQPSQLLHLDTRVAIQYSSVNSPFYKQISKSTQKTVLNLPKRYGFLVGLEIFQLFFVTKFHGSKKKGEITLQEKIKQLISVEMQQAAIKHQCKLRSLC